MHGAKRMLGKLRGLGAVVADYTVGSVIVMAAFATAGQDERRTLDRAEERARNERPSQQSAGDRNAPPDPGSARKLHLE